MVNHWLVGDEGARDGDYIEAVFLYTTNGVNDHEDFLIVRWDAEEGSWVDSTGDVYDGPSDELPNWYRKFYPPYLKEPE